MDENIIQDNTSITKKNSNINKNKSNNDNINDSNKEIILNNEKDLEDDNIVIHFDTYKKDSNISKFDNVIQHNDDEIDDFSNLNKAQFITDNSIDNESNNFDGINNINNNINNIGKKKKKKTKNKKNKSKPHKENEIPYNYENLMCPPIKNDDSD